MYITPNNLTYTRIAIHPKIMQKLLSLKVWLRHKEIRQTAQEKKCHQLESF